MQKLKLIFLKIRKIFKLKFFGRQSFFQIFKGRRWLFIPIIFIFLVVTYFLILIIFISPARIKLLEFQKNINADGPCHEDCLLVRKQLKGELVFYFKRDKHFQENVRQLFLTENANSSFATDLNFKKELLEIMAIASGAGNPPDFVADYFLSAGARPELKAEIIRLFLASTANPDVVDYYFSILNSKESMAVKTEAIKALSSLSDKSTYFKVEEIAQLEDLVLNNDTPLNLKIDLIFLLSDFYEFFPTESLQSLTAIFQSSSQNVVKAFASDSLKNLGFLEFLAPEVTEAEWAEYFNN